MDRKLIISKKKTFKNLSQYSIYTNIRKNKYFFNIYTDDKENKYYFVLF